MIEAHVARAIDSNTPYAGVRASLDALLAAVRKKTSTYDEVATRIAARIVVENRQPLLTIPAALDALMPAELARSLITALRKELGHDTPLTDRAPPASHEIGVHLAYEELAAMLGDVRDDRPAVLETVQRISARMLIAGADYAVLDLDPEIEKTPLGRRILRRLPMLAAELAESRFELGRLMLVVRAGALAPYARILDVARIHFRAVACPGKQPELLDSVSPGSSAAHLYVKP